MRGVGPGTVLGGRYTVHRRLEQIQGTERWTADDSTLGRAVHVVTVTSTDHRAAALLDAARRAASVTHAVFVRVLDVGTDADVSYLVEEELDEARTLTQLVTDGGLPGDEVRRITGEVAAALETARQRGMHHLDLTPDAVLRTPDGDIRLRGLGTAAVRSGEDALDGDDAARRDAVGVVALAYAGLTGLWPLRTGGAGLAPAPRVPSGVASPSEIAAGVPRDLDALCRLTLNDDQGPVSPGDYARQVAPWPSRQVVGRPTTPTTPAPAPAGEPPAVAPSSAPATAEQPAVPPQGDTGSGGSTGSAGSAGGVLGAAAAAGAVGAATGAAAAAQAGSAASDAASAATSPVALPPVAGGPDTGSTATLPVIHDPAATAATSDDTATLLRTPPADPAPLDLWDEEPEPAPAPRGEPPAWLGVDDHASGADRAGLDDDTDDTDDEDGADDGSRAAGVAAALGSVGGRVSGLAKRAVDRVAELSPDTARAPGSDLDALDAPAPMVPADPLTKDESKLALGIVVGFVVLALVVGIWGVTRIGSQSDIFETGSVSSTRTTTVAPPSATPTGTGTNAAKGEPLAILGASAYDPQGDDHEHDELVPKVYDGNPATGWNSESYSNQNFGNLKKGVGIVVDLGPNKKPQTVQLVIPKKSAVQVWVGPDGRLDGATMVGENTAATGTVTFQVPAAVSGQYVIVWFTKVYPDDKGDLRAWLNEVIVTG